MKHLTILLACAMLVLTSAAPTTPLQEEEWHLPMKDGLIQMEYSTTYSNKKQELCTYYTSGMMLYNVMTRTNNELSGKGGKLLSTTNYTVVPVMFNADASAGKVFIACNTAQNDTLMGSLTIMITKSSLKLTGVKNTFNTVKCRFKVVFEGKDKMHIKFRGFTVTDSKYNASKGGMQYTETDLEEVYKEFEASPKKKKSETYFFKDIKVIIDIFYHAIQAQMEKDIKVAELD